MSRFVILAQVVLPLMLLLWIAFFPAKGWLAWGLQFISAAAVLLGIALVCLWTLPPFWVPYIYGLLLFLITAIHRVRNGSPGPGLWRASRANSVMIWLMVLPGILGGYVALEALKGRAVPHETVVDIDWPFPEGHYLVASGGSRPLINPHLKTLDQSVTRFRPWRGQSKALDIFRISPPGLHKQGWQPTDPEKYITFGVPVLSPCAGVVALVIDGIPDMPVPEMDRDHMAGNHVAVDCGGFYVILAHFRQGSIVVASGEKVNAGDILGQMGNSGNSSEPHLHLHAQRGLPEESPLAGEPLWLTIHQRFLVRNDRIIVRNQPQ